jgi:hypothetical protein
MPATVHHYALLQTPRTDEPRSTHGDTAGKRADFPLRLLEAHPRFTKIMKQPGNRRQQGDAFRTLPAVFTIVPDNLQRRAIRWHAPLRIKATQIPDYPQQLGLTVFFSQ